MPGLFIGLMSGTSLDGIDAVLADFTTTPPRICGHQHQAFVPELRQQLLALSQPGADELNRAALAANALSHSYAAIVRALLDACNVKANMVAAIGCHGQTVRHQPAAGYTIQLVNGALLAELTGIDVVCDFRSRDIAAGGQGAPLAPGFHQAAFASREIHRVIVNIGGIANLTDLPLTGDVTGFDCGLGNLLLDAWAQRHLKQPFDAAGAWGQRGKVLPAFLDKLQAHEFFQAAPPKSAGRDTFSMEWLDARVAEVAQSADAADVQATLLALTVENIVGAIEKFCTNAQEIYVCGGGARNLALMSTLTQGLPQRKVLSTDTLGIPVDQVEALAFAWLARQALQGQPGNLPTVTGARGARILGTLYQK